MRKKSGNFFEEHIEKIVLAVIGLVCIWLLVTRVFISPSVVSYDDKKLGTGNIDIYISEQVELLGQKLDRKPEPMQEYNPRIDDFAALVSSAVGDIDTGLYRIPLPGRSSMETAVRAMYALPRIPGVNDVKVGRIRAVAYIPTEMVNEENVYDRIRAEPNDLDFVTVEAKFDIAGLCKNFYESFSGSNVQEEWRDPCLAKPVFAAVHLQRQEQLVNDSWSSWEVVPRAKVDARRRMFEVIEDVEELPTGGIKVRLIQFDDMGVQMDLLQPQAYRIASAKEEWLPPSLHKKFIKQQREQDLEERREAREAEKAERERGREEARAERSSRVLRTRPRPVAGAVGEFDDTWYGGEESYGAGMLPQRAPVKRVPGERLSERERPERSRETPKIGADDIYEEFNEILLTDRGDFSKMHLPLVFWAHDDTVEPEKSYRYRIRLGVFNSIAGTEQFGEQDKHLKNKVILWSRFSEPTESVTIPGTLYFFPREIQETAKSVRVQISRYVMGYWYSKDFMVNRGEVIGKVVKSDTGQVEKGVTVPMMIDYSTGAVLVDVIPVNDWSGGKNLRARNYFEMLYSFDGADIDRVPVKTRYWFDELQAKFNEIRKSEKEPKEPLRDWAGRVVQRKARVGPDIDEYDEFDR